MTCLLGRSIGGLYRASCCGKMVNDMTEESNSQPITSPVLAPEVVAMIDEESVAEPWVDEELGQDYSIDEESMPDYWIEEHERFIPRKLTETELRELLLQRGLSKEDIDINLKVLRIRNMAFHAPDLVRLVEREYECGKIMALSLAVKEVERCLEEIGLLFGRVSHAQDKDALAELCRLLEWYAGEVYWDDLLREAGRVGAAYSEPHIPYEGRWYGGIDYALIEARFALDAIWDEERLLRRGTSERNRQRARSLARDLYGDPKVEEVRKSLSISPGGFQDLDAAHEWAKERQADWSPWDAIDSQELVWWECYTWDQHRQRPFARGYIMLDLPAMNEALEQLLDEHQLARRWYRVLPLYLIRGRLEPPPRERYPPRPMQELHQEIYELSKRHKPCWKAVLYFRYGLTDEDWSEIVARYPVAKNKRWSDGQKEGIRKVAEWIARRNGTYDTKRDWLTEAHVRKIRSRISEAQKT